MKIIGVDVGGTKICAGLIEEGKIIKKFSCATPAYEEKHVVVEAVASAISEVFDEEVAGIGIGVPGLVDQDENLVIDVTNIPSWDSVPLRDLIRERFGRPVFVNNDANCFAIGEKYFGKAKNYRNFVGMAIGTGLGAGIVINGHLYSGRFSGAGEFGNLYYLDQRTEAYCSGQFFKDRGLNGGELALAAQSGDEKAQALFFELGTHIGKAICNVLFALSPDAIVLGGSVAQSYPLFKAGMENALAEFPFRRLIDALVIEVSDVPDMAVLGASSLVMDAGIFSIE